MSSGAPTYDGKSVLVQDRYIVGNFIAGENLTNTGRAVYIDTAWSVQETDGSNHYLFGVTLTKANSADKIAIITRGIVYGTAGGSISAGYMLVSGATGRVEQAAAANWLSSGGGIPIFRAISVSSAAGAGSGVYFALW